METKLIVSIFAGFFIIILMAGMVGATSWTASLNASLEMYHNFNTTTDLIGKHNLSIYGQTQNNYNLGGIILNSIKFNGTSGAYANFSNSKAINLKQPQGYTVNLWANTSFNSATGAYKTLFMLGNASGYIRLLSYGNKPYLNIQYGSCTGNADLNCGASCAYMNDSKWHMYTSVVNATNYSIWVDGVFKVKETMMNCNSSIYTSNNFLGAEAATSRNYNITIDEFGLWLKPLNASDITDLYNAGNGLTYPLPTLVGNCTVPASGEWVIDCSKNCTWNLPTNIPGNVTIFNSGVLYLNNVWHFMAAKPYVYINNLGCKLILRSRGQFK